MDMIILYFKKDNTLKEVSLNDALDEIYYLNASVPLVEHINEYISTNKTSNITKYFKKNGIAAGINIIKENISTIESKIPLYDVYSENLYLIDKSNVYHRVVYNDYRFPSQELLDGIINNKKKLLIKFKKTNDILIKRKIRKIHLMISFMESYDINTLYNTYMKVFYLYSNEVGKNLTLCKRPSFLQHFTHIRPYYTRSEILNLALNIGLEINTDEYYDSDKLSSLCKTIKENDISSNTLLNHQKYIINNDKVGLIQYYTLQGSYFINKYLRRFTRHNYKDKYLESILKPMYDLAINAPAFDKSYVLYRFVHDDSYLSDLQVGDIYSDKGFMSTTRDPFYREDTYKFGFILLKIKIPANMVGVALCVETLSHFPYEQEIILPPMSLLKLVRRDDKCAYYHTNAKLMSQIKTRYEFEYIGRDKLALPDYVEYESKADAVDFLSIEKIPSISFDEKIRYFMNKYVNPMNEFIVQIGNNKYTIICEWYDSTGAYEKFYAIKTDNGFSFYTIHNNYVLFMIEIGEQDQERYMHVNYYVKYSTLDRNKILGDDNFVKFISSIGYYFEINQIIIYADYMTCDIFSKNQIQRNKDEQIGDTLNDEPKQEYKINKPVSMSLIKQRNFSDNTQIDNTLEEAEEIYYGGGNYCVDIYNYLKKNIKRFEKSNILNMELKPKYSYYQLNKLKSTDPYEILKKEDFDEIYQIYDKAYISLEKENNIGAFYVWMAENKCYLMETLVSKMDRLFPNINPFKYTYYILDPIMYLYNKKFINTYPKYAMSNPTHEHNIIDIPKNIYRNISKRV
jgi:hypothetical protein